MSSREKSSHWDVGSFFSTGRHFAQQQDGSVIVTIDNYIETVMPAKISRARRVQEDAELTGP